MKTDTAFEPTTFDYYFGRLVSAENFARRAASSVPMAIDEATRVAEQIVEAREKWHAEKKERETTKETDPKKEPAPKAKNPEKEPPAKKPAPKKDADDTKGGNADARRASRKPSSKG